MTKFEWEINELQISQCAYCVHKHGGAKTCDAFVNDIPDEIIDNKFDHRNSYPGDNDIQFELREDLPETAGEPVHLVE